MEQNLFVKAITTIVLVKNDCHYIHLHCRGVDFDKSHALTESYFQELNRILDVISEMALEIQESIPNYSLALQILTDYEPEHELDYDYFTVIETLKNKLCILVLALKDVREQIFNNSMQSQLDDIIRFWESELNYKLNRCSVSPVWNPVFINTGIDNQTVEFHRRNHLGGNS